MAEHQKKRGASIWEDWDLPKQSNHITSVCCLLALPCSRPIFNWANLHTLQVSMPHYMFWMELHILAQLGSWLQPPVQNWWQNTQRGISPLLVGEGQNTGLKKHVWGWGNSAVLWGKQWIGLPWRETRTNLKLSVSPREKLIPNSQACHVVEGDGNCSFTNPSQNHFWELTCSRKSTPLKKPRINWSQAPQSCYIENGNIYFQANQHTNIKKGQSLSLSKYIYMCIYIHIYICKYIKLFNFYTF
jgi:hypothetical protein